MATVIGTESGTVKLTNGKATFSYTLKQPNPPTDNILDVSVAAPISRTEQMVIQGIGTSAKLTWDRDDARLGSNLIHQATYTNPALPDGATVNFAIKTEVFHPTAPSVIKATQNLTSVKTASGKSASFLLTMAQNSTSVAGDLQRVTVTVKHGTTSNTYVKEAHNWKDGTGIPYISNGEVPYDLPANGLPCNRNISWYLSTVGTPIANGVPVVITIREYEVTSNGNSYVGSPKVINSVITNGRASFNHTSVVWTGKSSDIARRIRIDVDVPSFGRYSLFAPIKNSAT